MADFTVQGDTSIDTTGAQTGFSKIGGIAKKGFLIAGVAAAAATVKIVSSAVTAYASYEQLVGGVDTLFGESSDKVQAYAENAYKTAGLSANAYMETVTGFSASLLQSLGGDTDAAADKADMAITDMSDNANKMGTSMDVITQTYQGFAKQNYTMLDNLKLGYGGTKTEMERLLTDATAISGVEYDVSSYADVVDAIHVVQTEMGVTGTTAKEAESTISGSLNMLKGSYENLLVGLGDPNADLEELSGNMIDSLMTFLGNVMPIIENIVMSLIDIMPQLIEVGISLIVAMINGIAQALPQLIPAIIDGVLLIIQTLIDNLPLLIDAGIQIVIALALGLIEALPQIVEKIPVLIDSIISALIEALPQLIDAGVILFVAIIQNLPAIIAGIIKAIPQIITGIVGAFSGLGDDMADVGQNIIDGIWDGITGGIDWLLGKVGGFATSIVDKAKDALDINSPSKKFMWLGQMSAEGMAIGFENNNPLEQISTSLKSGMANIKANASIKQDIMLNGMASTPANYNQVVNINQPVSQSPSDLSRVIRRSSEKMGLAGAI